jgi:hypothetical protein
VRGGAGASDVHEEERLDKNRVSPQRGAVRIALAWLAALVTYPVATWLVRFVLTVLTLPLGGLLGLPRPLPTLRSMRLVGSAVCGLGGFFAAAWISSRLGQHAPLLLGVLLFVAAAANHGLGLRRLAGGPQFAEELFTLIGEELGLVAGIAWHLLA